MMKTVWLLAFFVVASSVHDTEAWFPKNLFRSVGSLFLSGQGGSFPPNRESHPNGSYWFGTQNLFCMSNKDSGKSKRSAPWRFTKSPMHSLIYYRNAVYENVMGKGTMRSTPDWGDARKCPVTWELSPSGHSQCSVDEVKIFVRGYHGRYGNYSLLLNNCHHFVNRVSQFLYDSNCGRNGWPE